MEQISFYFSIASIIITVIIFLILFFVFNSRFDQLEKKGNTEVIDTLSKKIQEIDTSNRLSFENLSKNLGALSESTKQMMEVGKTINSLEDLLKPPKLRGGMGETLLEELLGQILPSKNYLFQHRFKTGNVVDAIILLGEGMVPVDAKFPLEQFKRLMECEDETAKKKERKAFLRVVKKHIEDIAQKYILPDEGTYDFALMYIPAENVYYETIIKDEDEEGLYPFALEKRVIPVSPNSFYAYLEVVIYGLKGLRIEEKAREIMNQLSRLHGEEVKFKKEFETLGTHISNARNKYEDASKQLGRFEDKLLEVSTVDGASKIPESSDVE